LSLPVTTDVHTERQYRLAASLPRCDGHGLKRLVHAGLAWLETNHQIVNALNVFPVPDGDTGTNMLMTMQAAYREVADSAETSVSKVAQAVAHGALMGARGNSGVILSQIWRGFARGLDGAEIFDIPTFVHAMREACDTAYRGVVKPVEGTILTVIKGVAAAAERVGREAPERDLRHMLDEIVEAGWVAVEHTPDLLPVLKQAGVVDSGGKGFAYILEGMQRYLRGQRLDQSDGAVPAPLDLAAVGAALDAVEPGQEWEVVVDFRPRGELNLPTLYQRLEEMGASIQVGEGDGLYRVHIHLLKVRRHEPIELAEELGIVVKVHMENLLDQMEGIQGAGAGAEGGEALPLRPVQAGQIGVVAVSPGPGFSRLLASLGASAVVTGGQTKNPSTEEILSAIGGLATDKVVVLPNNKNIILAAEQAAGLSVKQVRIVPTRSVPQGIAAMLQLVPEGDLDEVQAAMDRARRDVETGEVTRASRTVEINGVSTSEGDIIGLHNGVLAVSGQSLEPVLLDLLAHMLAAERELVTLYHGVDVTPEQAEAMSAAITARFPNLGVEVHSGGQPYYYFILSVE
jgi:DAK2 domain fusion protein YloV